MSFYQISGPQTLYYHRHRTFVYDTGHSPIHVCKSLKIKLSRKYFWNTDVGLCVIGTIGPYSQAFSFESTRRAKNGPCRIK